MWLRISRRARRIRTRCVMLRWWLQRRCLRVAIRVERQGLHEALPGALLCWRRRVGKHELLWVRLLHLRRLAYIIGDIIWDRFVDGGEGE